MYALYYKPHVKSWMIIKVVYVQDSNAYITMPSEATLYVVNHPKVIGSYGMFVTLIPSQDLELVYIYLENTCKEFGCIVEDSQINYENYFRNYMNILQNPSLSR